MSGVSISIVQLRVGFSHVPRHAEARRGRVCHLQHSRYASSLPTPTKGAECGLDVGYKLGAKKTVDELANLDAEDESLARWKASLGIVPGAAAGENSGPKVCPSERTE